jgi:hypothetical protein
VSQSRQKYKLPRQQRYVTYGHNKSISELPLDIRTENYRHHSNSVCLIREEGTLLSVDLVCMSVKLKGRLLAGSVYPQGKVNSWRGGVK